MFSTKDNNVGYQSFKRLSVSLRNNSHLWHCLPSFPPPISIRKFVVYHLWTPTRDRQVPFIYHLAILLILMLCDRCGPIKHNQWHTHQQTPNFQCSIVKDGLVLSCVVKRFLLVYRFLLFMSQIHKNKDEEKLLMSVCLERATKPFLRQLNTWNSSESSLEWLVYQN